MFNGPVLFHDLTLLWSWHPGTLFLLLLFSLLYILRLRQVRRAYPQDTSIKPLHVFSFFLAILLAATVLLTPIDTIARTQLFSVHMTQIIVLTTFCTPLLMFGCPAIILRLLMELPVVRDIVRWLTRPLTASIIFNLTFFLWHLPTIFNIAQRNETLYQLEIVSIFLTSLLNWWPLLSSQRATQHMTYPMQMLYAFFDGQPVDIFAFVLVFTGVTIYKQYVIPPQLNLSSFADQTVAGALLLLPGLVDLVVMTPLFFRWLGHMEQLTRQEDQQREEEENAEEYEEEKEETAQNIQ